MTTSNANDYVVTEDMRGAGSVVFWEFTGTADRHALNAALMDAGVDGKMLPKLPTMGAAIAKAGAGISGSTVKLSQSGSSWFLCAKYYDNMKRPEFRPVVEARVRYTAVANGVSVHEPEFTVLNAFDPNSQTLCDAWRNETIVNFNNANASEIGTWLAQYTISALQGVSLRNRGGFYFVPTGQRDKLDLVKMAIGDVYPGASVYQIPAMNAKDAADAVLAAVEAEAMEAAAKMDEWLDAHVDNIQERSQRLRENELAEIKNKLTTYETLFSRRLDDVHARLARVKSKLRGTFVLADGAIEGRAPVERIGSLELDDSFAAHTNEPGLQGERRLELD